MFRPALQLTAPCLPHEVEATFASVRLLDGCLGARSYLDHGGGLVVQAFYPDTPCAVLPLGMRRVLVPPSMLPLLA